MQSPDCNVFSITTLDDQLRSRAFCGRILCFTSSEVSSENNDPMGLFSTSLSFAHYLDSHHPFGESNHLPAPLRLTDVWFDGLLGAIQNYLSLSILQFQLTLQSFRPTQTTNFSSFCSRIYQNNPSIFTVTKNAMASR